MVLCFLLTRKYQVGENGELCKGVDDILAEADGLSTCVFS